MSMKFKSRHIVTPAEATWHGILPLAELDQVGLIAHASVLYFYVRPTQDWLDSPNNKILRTLKDSLSRALVPFYPFAGRLSCIGGGRLKLECNAMGAELTEAESTKKISDYGDFSYSSLLFAELLPHMDYAGKPTKEIPLLAAQVTRFACGGICVGIEFSHVIADGKSAIHFIEEWARLARGEPLKVAPYVDRRILLAEPVDGKIGDNPLTQQDSGEQIKDKQLFPTFVVLTKDQIGRLKDVANDQAHELVGRPYSRLEVIIAHIWRCMSMARGLKSEKVVPLYLYGDSRSRMEPPLPSSYFGNGSIRVEASTSAGELISKPLSYACSKVREAYQKLTNEYVIGTIKFLKTEQSLTKHQFMEDRGNILGSPNGDGDDMQGLMIISWMNVPVQGIDFGWGKETYVGPPTGFAGDGRFAMVIPHKNNDGTMVVAAWLKAKEEFLKCMGLALASKF